VIRTKGTVAQHAVLQGKIHSELTIILAPHPALSLVLVSVALLDGLYRLLVMSAASYRRSAQMSKSVVQPRVAQDRGE
jgi:hypothetical protein